MVKMSMPNASETIERLARESERRRILEIASECKDVQEVIEKIKALLNAE